LCLATGSLTFVGTIQTQHTPDISLQQLNMTRSDSSAESIRKTDEIRRQAKKKRKAERKAKNNEGPLSDRTDSERKKQKQKQSDETATNRSDQEQTVPRPLVESYATPNDGNDDTNNNNVALLLFYQYVQPLWTPHVYKLAQDHVHQLALTLQLAGRIRIAAEGLNCTLTGSVTNVRDFCHALRAWKPLDFNLTEFKLTLNLPDKQRFRELKLMPVTELVNYGLHATTTTNAVSDDWPRHYQGTHLEPADYHARLSDPNAVVIDVRNHYEAAIGRFDAPNSTWLDPKMRKSTEFPAWLNAQKDKFRGKSVLMYCTGGIRCERASALLQLQNEREQLGIKGVYQLQGGIDKYFKVFPDGGYWKGKNYVFDKRFAHVPAQVQAATTVATGDNEQGTTTTPLGVCEACAKPWDMYRGKRRCPTCGVPSLICKACWQENDDGKRLDKWIRCDLCVEQNVRSKRDLREREEQLVISTITMPTTTIAPNPDNVTRLFLKNMCRNKMTEQILFDILPGITHLVWRVDRKTNQFLGQGWVEMASPDAAARAVAKSGLLVLGRPISIVYQPADGKDAWPPPSSCVKKL
jgi:predicted sulfurtransferase